MATTWEIGAGLANALWWGRGAVAARQFAAALRAPREAQWRLLSRTLQAHRGSEYGARFGFGAVTSEREYRARVPLVGYDDLAPHVERIHLGAPRVLISSLVTHLAPTSGSTGARKLIPFTAELQRGFRTAVDAWWGDLIRQRPSLLGGPSYWSISPLEQPIAADASGAVRVGFSDDADYLGGAGAWLVRRALVVPAAVRHVREMDPFWGLTLVALLRRRGLRMLSVWHPSFVELLVENAERSWDAVLEVIASGRLAAWGDALPPAAREHWHAAPAPTRAAELRGIGPRRWPEWWPALAAVSAWGDQAAAPGFARLRAAAPRALVQAKGLLATEGVVTIPFRGDYPVAINSHYFEFMDRAGAVRGVHELERGGQYEVVLTNGGGLWRYRLGDVVECTGHLAATPTLRFVGRAGRVSDLRGEKLSEAFVAEVLRGLWKGGEALPAVLRAYDDRATAGYELSVPEAVAIADPGLAARCEEGLAANPHYALARRLGQLKPLRIVIAAADDATRALATHRGRLGDAKPQVLVAVDAPHLP